MIGSVRRINRDRGFAFITRVGEPDVFLHVSAMTDRGQFDLLQEEQQVEFESLPGEKGPRAVNVRIVPVG